MPIIQNPIVEGKLRFTFPQGALSTKYDDWSFYRTQFNSAFGGTKAVDIIYLEDDVMWLIEVKDYRQQKRQKTMPLYEEVALKVKDSVAGLTAAYCNANDPDIKDYAKKALKQTRIRVVLHLEQPPTGNKLFSQALNPANIQMKMKQWLRALDPHPLVVDKSSLTPAMRWTVV